MSKATDKEIAEHINTLLDELKWFHAHKVKLHISPSEAGWKIQFSVTEKITP